MSQENVEIVRAVYDAWQRGDYEGVFKSFDEEVEWIGPPDVSGAGERGDTTVSAVSEEIFSVWTLQGGTIVRQRMFRDRSQALEAAGLRE